MVRQTIETAQSTSISTLDAIRETSRGIVKTTADVGGDVGTVARDTVDESIATARDLGTDAGLVTNAMADFGAHP